MLAGRYPVAPEQPFVGLLRFGDGETVSVEGVVQRSDEKEVVVDLSRR